AARALVEAGHEIGNHSYSHQRMVLMRPASVRAELGRTDAAIRAAGYDGPIRFRPPYGKKLVVLPWVLAKQNHASMMWSLEPRKDFGANAPVDVLVQEAVAPAEPGDIILLHPMYDSRATTRAALPAIIDGLRAKGLEPVPLGMLLAAGQP
ncbi:MAG: polysaccharide deacetylase family protein, partial [Maritimibacter sp.]